jgi:type IV pilus assembly protein PilV
VRESQRGFFLIEAMVAILIFALGILGLVAMGGAAIAAQTDAQYRTEAARFADEIASKISLNVDRSDAATIAASLDAYQHQPGGADCQFSGNASANALVTAWVAEVSASGTGLPGATPTSQQIRIETTVAGGFNRVAVTLCWQAPNDKAARQHTLVTYVN